jgi:hypothetical protein
MFVWFGGVPKPGKLQITLIKENGENMLEYKILLPAHDVKDLVDRELTVTVGDTVDVFHLAPDAMESAVLTASQDSVVSLSLVDVDDAGNRSEASVLEVTITDTIAPPTPGTLSVVVVGEQ